MLLMLKNLLASMGFNKAEKGKSMPPDQDEPSTLPTIILERFKFSDQGVLGRLLTEDGESFLGLTSIELPWRNNARMISCIPRGVYTARKTNSPKFGECYQVIDVPGRSNILFHHGNFAGDTSKGFRADSNGCILLGYKHGKLQGQDVVLSSRTSRAVFETSLDWRPFKLIITESR